MIAVVFMGAFGNLRKATDRFFMSVRPRGKTRFPINEFSLNLILSIIRKFVAEFQDSLGPDKNKE